VSIETNEGSICQEKRQAIRHINSFDFVEDSPLLWSPCTSQLFPFSRYVLLPAILSTSHLPVTVQSESRPHLPHHMEYQIKKAIIII